MIGAMSIGAASIGSVPLTVAGGNFGLVYGGDLPASVVFGGDLGGNGLVFGSPGTASTGDVVFGHDTSSDDGIVVGGDDAPGVVYGSDERAG